MTQRKAKTKRTPQTGAPRKFATKVKTAPKNAAAATSDWRAETLAEVRRIIQAADPEIVEECKWVKPTNPAGVPTWSHAGIVCTGETYKEVVKLTFAKGASIKDPRGLFNSSLEGNTRRAIDVREGEVINAKALTALIQAAVAENLRASGTKSKPAPKTSAKAKPSASKDNPVKLLSGGNPQIAKADGDAPVQAYIAAMPDWKCDVGKRLDALVERHVPKVRKAVKWNSPFYGTEDKGWFLSFHVFTRYVKVTFFNGTSLKPVPTGGTAKDARWFDIHEDDELNEAQLTAWIKQSAALPGWFA
jgi:hypothetical protein